MMFAPRLRVAWLAPLLPAALLLAIFGRLVAHPSWLIADADRPSVDRATPPDGHSVGNDLTRLFLPHQGFNRKVGAFAGQHLTPTGEIVDEATGEKSAGDHLPTAEDRARVAQGDGASFVLHGWIPWAA